jgi:phosphoglycolate phosphatase-like HAD superfamily hydrolase
MPTPVLFDIDGTLVLTGGAGVRAMNRAFEETFDRSDGFAGVPMAGRTDQIIVRDALTRHQFESSSDRLDDFRNRYYRHLAREMHVDGPRKGVLPGVRPLLDELSVHPDAVVGLLTGNFAEGARIKLEYFDLWKYFPWGAFGDDAVERNDLVAVAVERMKNAGVSDLDHRRVTIVGDTPLDIACAHASGARAIAVATGPHDVASLTAAGADAVLEDLGDTGRVLELLLG